MISTGNKIIIGAILATAVMAGLGYAGYRIDRRATAIENSRWELEVGKLKLKAADELRVARDERDLAQGKLNTALAAQERADDANKEIVAGFEVKLRAARALSAGRMRDPNATGCGGGRQDAAGQGSSGPISGGGNAAEASGLLSTELTGLLDKLTREADDINVAYASCRADAFTTRALIPTQ